MSNTEQKPSKMRRVIIATILFVILIGFPAGSYLYMRSGVSWRKQAVSELGQYGKIRPAFLILSTGEKQNRLESCVSVIHIFGKDPDLTDVNRKIIDNGERLFNQFGKLSDESIRRDFRLAMIAEGGTAEFYLLPPEIALRRLRDLGMDRCTGFLGSDCRLWLRAVL